MRRDTRRFNFEAPGALACRHHLAAVARRLGHQYIARPPRFSFNEIARRRAANLLVGRENERNRQARAARACNLAEGLERKICAAFHVVEARPIEAIAITPEWQGTADGANRVHGVDV